MEMLISGLDVELVKNFFGEAASSEFTRTLVIFGLAALVHARQVRKEIKTQFGELVAVLREDLDATKTMIGSLSGRVAKLEERYIKED